MTNTKSLKILDAITVTAASKKIFVGGSRVVGLHLRRANHTSGTSVFSVKVSMEPGDTTTPTMTALNLLIDNVTNTNAQNLTRVASKSLGANADAFLFFDPSVKFNWIEVTGTITTDGDATAFLLIED